VTISIDDLHPRQGNLYHNPPNQIRRAIGRYVEIYVGDRCGTQSRKASP
jgi:hypothetical protein